MSKYDSALRRVLEKAGGPSRVAEHLGIVPSAVTQWTKVPARHVPRLEALTGIPGAIIRPDLYPSAPPPDSAARDPVLDEAFAIAGGAEALAKSCGLTLAEVRAWRSVPSGLVAAVEAATGIPRARLRPDLYPAEEQEPARADRMVA